jgi:hypothetical protein
MDIYYLQLEMRFKGFLQEIEANLIVFRKQMLRKGSLTKKILPVENFAITDQKLKGLTEVKLDY